MSTLLREACATASSEIPPKATQCTTPQRIYTPGNPRPQIADTVICPKKNRWGSTPSVLFRNVNLSGREVPCRRGSHCSTIVYCDLQTEVITERGICGYCNPLARAAAVRCPTAGTRPPRSPTGHTCSTQTGRWLITSSEWHELLIVYSSWSTVGNSYCSGTGVQASLRLSVIRHVRPPS